jgi:hypothetical protein
VPAVAAAIRAATGLPLPASPIRPEHIALGVGEAPHVEHVAGRDPEGGGTTGVVDDVPGAEGPWSPWGHNEESR